LLENLPDDIHVAREFLSIPFSFSSHFESAPECTFFITAVMHFREPPVSQGPKAKQPKKASETKTGPAFPLFAMKRCEVLLEVLKLHDLHPHYQPSEISGFPFEISWTGSL